MDAKEKFDTPEKLCDFILNVSGGMEYDYFTYPTNHRVTLGIRSNMDIQKIYFLDCLLRKMFKLHIKVLFITDIECTEIESGYLDVMNIQEIQLPRDLEKIPKLPRTLRKISIGAHSDSVISKDGNFWRILKDKGRMGRFYCDSLDDCLRSIEDGTYNLRGYHHAGTLDTRR